MRGFPLFNLLAVVAVLLLMLWPLLRVDRPVVVPEAADVTVPVPAGIPVLVALRFVTEPSAVQVRLGEEVLTLRGSGLERQAEARLIPADRALELAVEAVWPAGTGSPRPTGCRNNSRICGGRMGPSRISSGSPGGPSHECPS
jgi:hypothetical protein